MDQTKRERENRGGWIKQRERERENRGGCIKQRVSQSERRYTLCNNHDTHDEIHYRYPVFVNITSFRVKCIQPYYYGKPSKLKFVELMGTENRRDLHRLIVLVSFYLNYKCTL